MTLRRIDNKFGARFYETPDGDRLPSVTSILSVIGKPALINWAANQERALVIDTAGQLYDELPSVKMSRMAFVASLQKRLPEAKAHRIALETAGEIGTAVHAMVEWSLLRELGQEAGPAPSLEGPAAFAFASWQKWREATELKPLLVEQKVYSTLHGYAGTLDLYAEVILPDVGVVNIVMDWKTGKGIYPEALLQNAAYVQALGEMSHCDSATTFGGIGRFPKSANDPPFEVRLLDPKETARRFQNFLHALDLWKWLQEVNDYKPKKKAKPLLQMFPADPPEQPEKLQGGGFE